MNINKFNGIFSSFIKMNQRIAPNRLLLGRLAGEDKTPKQIKKPMKKVDSFIASHENSYQPYQAAYQSSAAYKATLPESAPQAVELELAPPARLDRDFMSKPLPDLKLSPFDNIVNGHYFSNLSNAKLAGDSISEPFASEALNKTLQLSNQLFNVNMRNNEGGFSNRDLHGNLAALANAYDIMYKDLTKDNNGQTHFLEEAMKSHLYFNAQQSTFAAVKYEDYPDEASYVAARDAMLEENVHKANEFADVFLKNYKKHGMDAVAMAFEAMDK